MAKFHKSSERKNECVGASSRRSTNDNANSVRRQKVAQRSLGTIPATTAKKTSENIKKLISTRKALLHCIIDQMLLEAKELTLPHNLLPELHIELARAGHPIVWAKAQPAFRDFWAAKIERKQRQERQDNSQPFGASVTPEDKSLTPIRRSPPLPSEKQLRNARRALMLAIVSLLIRGRDLAKPLKINPIILSEVKKAGGPLNWLRTQPKADYASALRTFYRELKTKKIKPPPKAPQRKARRKKIKPIGDVPVSYIERKLQTTEDEDWDLRKIDWSVT